MSQLSAIRERIRHLHMADERIILKELAEKHGLSDGERKQISTQAADLISRIRKTGNPSLMEVFLAEYGLSTDEGIALMCLAESLLRVPDAETINELIEDKIAPSSWSEHLGKSSSSLVNASTWALMLTGKVLKYPETQGLKETLQGAIKRLGEPVIRTAARRVIKEMGHQFVLGRNIKEAIKRGIAQEKKGFTYSYDMLGEAALTASDAESFFEAYSNAIKRLTPRAKHHDIRENPGISIKLSALHPRYEVSQKDRVMRELVPRVIDLALLAKNAQMGFNIDAEEADRLDLSLDVIEAVLQSPKFTGWKGFGVVVQAYGKRAAAVIDWFYELARELDRTIMVRLVKGAYWDTEIKQAQVDGVRDFPVFTEKAATDLSYICCAKKLLDYSDRIYPQFATHNAHTVCAILNMAGHNQSYEFQRLHGMGEALHKLIHEEEKARCRIYAPVGAHRDLLSYLVRRLLENGANSSFVNQIVNQDVSPELIAADPFEFLKFKTQFPNQIVTKPNDIYQPERQNSIGWDLRNFDDLQDFEHARSRFRMYDWVAKPIICGMTWPEKLSPVFSPNDPEKRVGYVAKASPQMVEVALKSASNWTASAKERCYILNKAADLYERNAGEIFAALCSEAGKTALDAVAEIREAVDFLRFYGSEAKRLADYPERGVITCISPWNFPLAIFTGQISAALAAGNGVLAKPADPTPIIASIGVKLMHKAGVPESVLQLIPGKGSVVGPKLTTDTRVNGICFTGSIGVAQIIYRGASKTLEPDSTFIAETGGLNAMIVDSTALPEQAIKDIINSSFRSCGQRCSALRMLYLQKDIADEFMQMLYGAMDELEISDSWNMSSDVGPVITQSARQEIADYVEQARRDGTLLKQLDAPETGLFLGPAVIRVNGVLSLEKEIFGPVLHITTFEASEIDKIINDINSSGYGLTFGLHTRIDERVEHITSRLNVGNIYVNRNQIGAVVGSQPFGGEGMSGTGPKAGGPYYVSRFKKAPLPEHKVVRGDYIDPAKVQVALDEVETDNHMPIETIDMPGPTGETNRWSTFARGTILCLGPTKADAAKQAKISQQMGCAAVCVAPGLDTSLGLSGLLARQELSNLSGFDGVALWSSVDDLKTARQALAERKGPLIPLISTNDMKRLCVLERHLCIDTTAAGGNASLLAAQ